MSVLKDHKDFLLPVIGIVAVLLILMFSVSGDDNLGLGSLTDFNSDGNSTSVDTDQSNKNGKYSVVPQIKIDSKKDYRAIIHTSKGDVEVDLYEKLAPNSVNSFVFLANDNFYDGLIFHRVISYPYPFMIQGGDPKGDGTGGPGYTFGDEINAKSIGLNSIKVKDADYLSGQYDQATLNEYADRSVMDLYAEVDGYSYSELITSKAFKDGVLAMANSDPSTNGSQFFITLTGSTNYTKHLNGKHTVFGEVTSGMNVVDSIAAVDTDSRNKPLDAIKITDVEIVIK